jgi:alpha-beta hydrolase superfamily lysophospholipase
LQGGVPSISAVDGTIQRAVPMVLIVPARGVMREMEPAVPDFSLLDRPQIRSVMFYPQPDRSPAPSGAHDVMIPAAHDVSLHARIYAGVADRPSIIFFHGNGELVSDYDDIATLYSRAGLNLVVSDYRGYGQSTGEPTYTTMMTDAHLVKSAILSELEGLGWQRGRYLMGRSLGALSALELAATDSSGVRGVILESGAASVRGWTRFVSPGEEAAWAELAEAQRQRIASIRLPLLTIHGASDQLIPVERAIETHETAGSVRKELLIVPGAGHNDLLAVGMRAYFDALSAFIAGCEAD